MSLLIATMLLVSIVPSFVSNDASAGPIPTFTLSTISSTNDVGKFQSIALDSNDNIHLSFHDQTNGELRYATNATGTWASEILETGSVAGRETSLAIDSNNKVHIAYYNYPNSNLRYATNEVGSWQKSGIDTAGDVGRYNSLALDSNNNVHIAYYDATNGNLKYATDASGSWVVTAIDAANNVGLYASIAIDLNDRAHISYYDYTNGDLRYATNSGGAWMTSSIDTAGTVGEYTSIEIDSLNNVHICYWDLTTKHLKYATNEEGAWTLEPIVPTTITGIYTDMVLDSHDSIHMVFYDSLNTDLKYANNVNDVWDIGTVDSTGDVGQFPSIGIDSKDNVHITYYDVTNGDLKYAYQMLTAPDAPTNLQATSGNAVVDLSWTAPLWDGGSVVTNYGIYRGSSSGGETLLTTIGNTLAYQDAAAVNGQTYWYCIKAVNAIGSSVMSNEASATPMTVPSAPSNLQADGGNGFITLSWGAPTDDGGSEVLCYMVYKGTTIGSESALLLVSGTTTYLDGSLTNGVTYWYCVKAINVIGEGASSNEVSATPMSASSSPEGFRVVPGTENITLTWEAPSQNGGSAIMNYVVYRGTEMGEETLYITLGNVLNFTDTDVEEGVTYWYYVHAVTAAGPGANSSKVMGTIATEPSAPTGLQGVHGNNFVALNWIAPDNDGGASIVNYSIYRGSLAGEETLLITLGNVLTYLDQDVELGNTYWYYVTASNSAGESNWSAEVSESLMTIPTTPRDLTAVAGSGNITLTWAFPLSDGGTEVTHFIIFRGNESGESSYLTTVENALTYVDDNVTNGETYIYNVVAVNAAGSSDDTYVMSTPLILQEEGFDWIPWFHIILLIVVGTVLLYLYFRKKEKEREDVQGNVEGEGKRTDKKP